jgi:hypothetical protein
MVVMNPGGPNSPKSGSDTPHSVSDIVNMEMDELLAEAEVGPAASMDSDEEDFVPQVSNDKEDFDLASIDEEFEVEDAHMMMLKMGIDDPVQT